VEIGSALNANTYVSGVRAASSFAKLLKRDAITVWQSDSRGSLDCKFFDNNSSSKVTPPPIFLLIKPLETQIIFVWAGTVAFQLLKLHQLIFLHYRLKIRCQRKIAKSTKDL